MKQVKKLVLMTIMLLMGSVCLAQEAKKDSIWGLEVKVTLIEKDDYLVRKNIQGEFYSNVKIENVDYLWCKYYDQYSTMLLNSENFKSKSKNECIKEGDSVYLVKFEWEMKVSSIAKETPFEVKLILQDGTESNKLVYDFSDVASLNKIESINNYDIYYYDILGNPSKPGKGVRIKQLYKDGHLYAVRKVLM